MKVSRGRMSGVVGPGPGDGAGVGGDAMGM